ncbi:MAG TPA: HAD-IB family hydrolase [Anaerolineae bacterium]|nr:HAD-IB family hydrolase [Anaerolineae bacterium]
MKKAAFFDVDGTLTSDNVWKGLMAYFKKHNKRYGTHLFFMLAHYPLYFMKKFGFISESKFRRDWAKHLAWYFRGYSLNEGNQIWTWVINEYLRDKWREDIIGVLKEHIAKGEIVMLVSAGPLPLVQYIADYLGADFAVGTAVENHHGHYTGKSISPVCLDEFKAKLSLTALEKEGIEVDLMNSYAYADSKTDIPLLEMVGNPCVVYPDEELRYYAKQKGWRVIG